MSYELCTRYADRQTGLAKILGGVEMFCPLISAVPILKVYLQKNLKRKKIARGAPEMQIKRPRSATNMSDFKS
jgi:hypothetical protein